MKIEQLQSKTAFNNHLKNIDFHVFFGSSTELHNHLDYYEVFYITQGPVLYIVNDVKMTLEKGDLTIVRPHDRHKFNNLKTDKTQHVNLAVKLDFFKIVSNIIDPFFYEKINNPSMPLVIKLTEFELKEMDYWKRKINTAKNANSEEMFANATTLLFLCLSLLNSKAQYSDANFPSWFNALLEKINTSEFISNPVKEIYKSCSFSPPLIIKTFKKHLAKTPVEYFTEVKINYACNLLQNTDYAILHIGQKVGYDSLSHFNRVFKKLKGQTPSEYRAKINSLE